MYCPKCGEKYKEGAKFCGKYGAKLEAHKNISHDLNTAKDISTQEISGTKEEANEYIVGQ